jgi:hypothetical protein
MRTTSVPQRTTSTPFFIPILTRTSNDKVLSGPVVAVAGALDAYIVCEAVGAVEVAAHV